MNARVTFKHRHGKTIKTAAQKQAQAERKAERYKRKLDNARFAFII